jgi:HTH-type transcriptional regulator/antitoxin HigA
VIANRLDKRAYAKLLVDTLPTVITSEAQCRRAVAIIDELMDRPRLTPEETQLLGLLGALASEFERKHYTLGKSEPHEHLADLLEERGLKRADLLPIFGHRSAISEVLAGKREITKNQAKQLAAFFNLPVEIFL